MAIDGLLHCERPSIGFIRSSDVCQVRVLNICILLQSRLSVTVIPLKSGIQSRIQRRLTSMAAFWIPLFSGMTT